MYKKDFGIVFGEDIREFLLETVLKFLICNNFIQEPTYKGTFEETLQCQTVKKVFTKHTPLWDVDFELHYRLSLYEVENSKIHDIVNRFCGVFIRIGKLQNSFYLTLTEADITRFYYMYKNKVSQEHFNNFFKMLLIYPAHTAVEELFIRYFN